MLDKDLLLLLFIVDRLMPPLTIVAIPRIWKTSEIVLKFTSHSIVLSRDLLTSTRSSGSSNFSLRKDLQTYSLHGVNHCERSQKALRKFVFKRPN